MILSKFKGIGNWTIDVYLRFVLQDAGVFPIGDLAAVNALKKLKVLPTGTNREQVIKITRNLSPYRSVASLSSWWFKWVNYLTAGDDFAKACSGLKLTGLLHILFPNRPSCKWKPAIIYKYYLSSNTIPFNVIGVPSPEIYWMT